MKYGVMLSAVLIGVWFDMGAGGALKPRPHPLPIPCGFPSAWNSRRSMTFPANSTLKLFHRRDSLSDQLHPSVATTRGSHI